ncbi:MAG: AraC family transcriptional regulator [Ruminococcaceae bacterium]|nr:AraC family transcriptional regulator [Oscillospiraceae bacterium]
MARSASFDEEYFLDFTNTNRGCYVTQLGRALPDPRYVQHKRALARYLFDFVQSGHGWVEYGGIRYQAAAGDLIYLKKGISVNYGASEDAPYEKLWLAADGPMLDALTSQYLGDRELIILHGKSDKLFWEMKHTLEHHGHDEPRVLHLMTDLVLSLSAIPSESSGAGELQSLAYRIRRYVDDHLNERLSLSGLADHFFISRRHLIRVFEEAFGMAPGTYHTGMRLDTAARYLAETDLSIREVAARLGYSDQSYFSTAFKHRFGMSPQAYRAENS